MRPASRYVPPSRSGDRDIFGTYGIELPFDRIHQSNIVRIHEIFSMLGSGNVKFFFFFLFASLRLNDDLNLEHRHRALGH